MKFARAVLFGVLGTVAMSLVALALRAIGLPLRFELILGTIVGVAPGPEAWAAGIGVHLVIGGLFGLLYGWLFERVWDHGGASTGLILGVIHAALIGMVMGLTPQFDAYVPSQLPDPGPYFSHLGIAGILAWFGMHLVYGAIVGAGYGHVVSEREWGAPVGHAR